MTEALFWRSTVQPRLSLFGSIHRIENRVGHGMPDTLYCLRGHTGLIELKHAYDWPKRAATPLTFNHFGLEQVLWIEDWTAKGGTVFILAQVGHDYMLFLPQHCRTLYQGATRAELHELAVVRGSRHFPTGAIVKCLATTPD